MNINITLKDYLASKNISFRESGTELITKCIFSDCDKDSTGSEAHLYFNTESGVYHCKKCHEKGNLFTLQKHFGDEIKTSRQNTKFTHEQVERCHKALPPHIRIYLNKRGISDAVIDHYKLGYGTFYRKSWITIPIKDFYGNWSFFKLRQDPSEGNEKITYPKGAEAQIYDWSELKSEGERIVICEGEMDKLVLEKNNISAITSTHGAMTFKKEWIEHINTNKRYFVCFDNDEAGRKGGERVAKMLHEKGCPVSIIKLPEIVGDHGDITDYISKHNLPIEDLFTAHVREYPEKIDTGQFKEMSSEDLVDVLGLTIKQDTENKLATFLCQLSAYTDNSQFNISYNAPSSTGKSFIPMEISKLFPNDDVLEIAYCSPTAFFHDAGEYDKEKNQYMVDLSNKILIFLDQPHNELLARLRPLLSHDKKEIISKITDKNQKSGTKTKNILLRGYPSVIFCTAGLRIDEQEATRFLLLSPEINQEKIQQGISATIRKEANNVDFKNWLNEDIQRNLLMERIRAIKLENISDINIGNPDYIEKVFLENNKILKPRHQRDVKRLLSLIKSFTLLNVWWRDKDNGTITANESDIREAFKLWDKIAVSQELNLPPYIYDIYEKVISGLWKERDTGKQKLVHVIGITRQEIIDRHFEIYKRMLDTHQLRMQILPMLETAGLIVQEPHPSDKRKMVIYPTGVYRTMHEDAQREYGEQGNGVENDISQKINDYDE